MTTPERFPILGGTLVPSIPWHMIARCESRALYNHGQTLARLAQRGGLSPREALAVISGLPRASVADIPQDRAEAVLFALLHDTPVSPHA